MRREHELRCFCRRKPLLATFGVDDRGEPFIHVKIWKQSRIFGELIIKGGEVKLRCRECLRWQRVIFGDRKAELTEVSVPDSELVSG